jgi:hypothetical protein
MASGKQPFDRIQFPELFMGLVAPVGVDLTVCRNSLRKYFEENYNIIEIKVTDVFQTLSKYISPTIPLDLTTSHSRIQTYIKYGDQLRAQFENDQLLSALTIMRVIAYRAKTEKKEKPNLYLLHQFKRREEIELLRSVYGRCFFQISAYSRRGSRVDNLSTRFAMDESSGMPRLFRGKAEELVQTDENEVEDDHGQRVSDIFHHADIIINHDASDTAVEEQTFRFCDLLCGSNKISPTKDEYGMFAAKAAALRTLDLSRQVGAALFTESGDVLSMGSNEVPKAGGGTYWADDAETFDDRDYVRNHDANDRRKRELLTIT